MGTYDLGALVPLWFRPFGGGEGGGEVPRFVVLFVVVVVVVPSRFLPPYSLYFSLILTLTLQSSCALLHMRCARSRQCAPFATPFCFRPKKQREAEGGEGRIKEKGASV